MTGCRNNRQILRSRITSVRALTSTWLSSSSLPWWQALFVAAFLFTYFAVRKKQLCRDKLSRRISPILTDGYQVFRRSCSKQSQANGFISMMVVPASAESAVATTKNTGSVHTASTRGGRPLMQKWHRTLVALAISSVQTLTPAPVGLARAVVAEPRPTDTDSLMVFVRAGYGLSTAAKAAMNPELTADRPLTAASDMPTLALAAHEWKDRDSITKHGLWKKDERAEVHLAIAVPEQGIRDIPVLKNGRLIVFVDTLALYSNYQCSMYSNDTRSVLLVHTDCIRPEHFQAVIDRHSGREVRGAEIPPVVKYFLGQRDQPQKRLLYAPTLSHIYQLRNPIRRERPPKQVGFQGPSLPLHPPPGQSPPPPSTQPPTPRLMVGELESH